jgi:Fe-S-cluster-containing dehydrogenase component
MYIDRCTGRRACEIACSFHHAKKFSPSFSSIKVRRDEKEGFFNLEISNTCDLCKDEREPLCIKYCAAKALDLKRCG